VIEPPELTGGHKRTVKDAADKNRMGHSRRQAAASGEAGKWWPIVTSKGFSTRLKEKAGYALTKTGSGADWLPPYAYTRVNLNLRAWNRPGDPHEPTTSMQVLLETENPVMSLVLRFGLVSHL
jgi:hypothetical protein